MAEHFGRCLKTNIARLPLEFLFSLQCKCRRNLFRLSISRHMQPILWVRGSIDMPLKLLYMTKMIYDIRRQLPHAGSSIVELKSKN